MSRHSRQLLVVAITALLGAGATFVLLEQRAPDTSKVVLSSPADPTPPSSSTAEPSQSPSAPNGPVQTSSADLADNRPERGQAPTALKIDAVGLTLPIQPAGVDPAGAMELPDTVNALTWYKYGPAPADPGATVIAGHLDTKSEGIGPLARLENLAAGDLIGVKAGQQWTSYRIIEVREVSKSLLDLDELFRRAGPRRLHLVTCAGAYDADRGGYQANLVVVARPAG
ncbi:MAG: class F sortase [Nocardioides sp.]